MAPSANQLSSAAPSGSCDLRRRPRASSPGARASRGPRRGRRPAPRAAPWRVPGGRGRRRGRARCTSSIRAGDVSPHSGSTSLSRPSLSRVTHTTGCSRRWMVSWRPAIALAIESTRNGMSSLTMPIRIRRRPASPPVDSIASATSPLRRRTATPARNSAASRSPSRVKPLVSPGSAWPGQRLAQCLDQRLGQARMDRHLTNLLRRQPRWPRAIDARLAGGQGLVGRS